MNRRIKIIASLLITIAFIYFLSSFTSVENLVRTLGSISIKSLVLVTLIYLGVYLLRAIRFKLLLLGEKSIKISSLFYITLVHGFYNKILPARTGEVSFIYLLHKKHNKSVSRSAFMIVLVRLYDLLSVCVLFFVAVVLNHKASIYNTFFIISVGVCTLIVCLLCFNIEKITKYFLHLMNTSKLTQKYNMLNKIVLKISGHGVQDGIVKSNRYSILLISITSILQWLLLYLVFYILILEFNYVMPLSHVILGSAYANITNIIPISGLGGFGTMEAGWVFGFSVLGVSNSVALETGFLVNLITFLLTVAFGILAILYDLLKLNKEIT